MNLKSLPASRNPSSLQCIWWNSSHQLLLAIETYSNRGNCFQVHVFFNLVRFNSKMLQKNKRRKLGSNNAIYLDKTLHFQKSLNIVFVFMQSMANSLVLFTDHILQDSIYF